MIGLLPVDAVAVVGNLIDNALDAARQARTGADRWVRVDVTTADGGAVAITVSDGGPGVPADVRERIFEHGFSTKPSDRSGRGVGLALVRDIVTAAGGSVELSADPTAFRVTLPGAPAERRAG